MPDIFSLSLKSLTLSVLVSITILSVLFLIALLRPIAFKIGLVDVPSERKRHGAMVPLVGGLALSITVLGISSVLIVPAGFAWFVAGAMLIIVTGLIDDIQSLGIKIRLALQTVASVIALVGSSYLIVSIDLDIEFVEKIIFNLSVFISVFAMVGLVNGFNMIDGIDGLAASQGLIAFGTIALAVVFGHSTAQISDWTVLWISALCGFLLVNLNIIPTTKVFLGDSGSMFTGFAIAWTLICYSHPTVDLIDPIMALWCVTLPVFDAITVMTVRINKKQSPFRSDRSHLHYRLIDAGLSPRKTLLLLVLVSTLLNFTGMLITFLFSPLFSLVTYCLLLSTFMGLSSKLNRASVSVG